MKIAKHVSSNYGWWITPLDAFYKDAERKAWDHIDTLDKSARINCTLLYEFEYEGEIHFLIMQYDEKVGTYLTRWRNPVKL